ncbi:cytochrome C [Skermanella stibiiresistens SB22]|uniref:Cytochrome C n=1 Tax=Skermanella stibiiresistens SB22 TaxID=1385369 RepID=W9H2D0_9PROT|nr:cytochrome c [Skermanella stibiiresistens]EWY40199.1 cytochrome C [Skermanella stibiiresistens SB22]
MRKNGFTTLATLAGALLIGTAALSGGVNASDDPLKTRKEGFEANKKAMGAIKKIFEDGADLGGIAAPAQAMADFAKRVPALFPPGSDKGETKAKPAIWTNNADFTAKAGAFEAETAKLVQLVGSGDKSAVQKQFGAVGGTCKACHDSYRSE